MRRSGPIARVRALATGRFSREFFRFTGSTLMVQASRLVVSLVAARLLGPDVWGHWFLLNLMLLYGSAFHLGVTNGMNREVPLQRGRGDPERIEVVQGVALTGVLWGSLVGASGLVLSAAFLTEPVLRSALPWMAFLFAITQVYNYLQTRLKSEGRFGRMSGQQAGFALLLPTLALPLTAWAGLPGFISGQAVATVLVVVALALDPATPLRPRASFRAWRALVRIGLPIMLAGLLYALLTTVDRWVIGSVLGTTDLGHYSLAILILGVLALVPRVIGQQIYPRMAGAYGRTGSLSEVHRWAKRQSLVSTGVTLPLAAVIAAATPPFVRWALPEYEPGVAAMQIVVIGPVVQSLSAGYGNLLNTVDRQRVYLMAQAVGVVVNVALSLSLVHAGFGIEGVAVATATSYAVYAVMVRWAGTAVAREDAPRP